jgi:CRISPR-associated endonuclease/helicase Cas3
MHMLEGPDAWVMSGRLGTDQSEAAELWDLWAKLKGSVSSPESYHPLPCHLLDVASVAEALWDLAMPAGARRWLCDLFGLAHEASARSWLTLFAGLHDIGKASPAFQGRSLQHRSTLQAHGLVFSPHKPAHHGPISAWILQRLLAPPEAHEFGLDANTAQAVAMAVGGHHGTIPDAATVNGVGVQSAGQGLWQQAQQALLSMVARFAHLPQNETPQFRTCHPTIAVTLLAGFTSVADWIGSSEEHFPYAPDCRDAAEYAQIARKRARCALDDLGWGGWSADEEVQSFEELFPYIEQPRPMQGAVVELAGSLDAPGLVLLEAPTGEGKTEAAFYLVDHWNRLLGQRGAYIAMPTQATANAMFRRFRDYLTRAHPGTSINFHLLHGQAVLSQEYEQLRRIGRIYDPNQQADASDTDGAGAIAAREWFSYKKRGLLGPFAVGTIDQALLGALRSRHVFVRLLGLAGKTIVLDEVHAYDTYTSTLLDRLLQWLAALGCSVVLLSATLPAARRADLLAAYAGKCLQLSQADYPCIVWSSGDEAGACGFAVRERQPVALRWGSAEQIIAYLKESLSEGGCGAWICNTVAEAQQLFLMLRNQFAGSDIELCLFHARYPFEQRQAREERAQRYFGKDTCARPRKALLVATQVIEQSLDLDFDVMVSAVAPIDLILQRAGRLHRHDIRKRPAKFRSPELWLVSPDCDADAVPNFGNSGYVYSRYILLRSWLALQDCQSLRVPDDVSHLIERVYGDEHASDQLADILSQLRCDDDERRERLEHEAARRVLAHPAAPAPLSSVLGGYLQESDDPQTHPHLIAATRWSDRPSITVVMLYGTSEQAFLDREHTEQLDLQTPPDADLTRRLVSRSVALTGQAIYRELVTSTVPAWRSNSLLRHLRVIYLDEDSCYEGESFTITLDCDLGVVVEYSQQGGDDA